MTEHLISQRFPRSSKYNPKWVASSINSAACKMTLREMERNAFLAADETRIRKSAFLISEISSSGSNVECDQQGQSVDRLPNPRLIRVSSAAKNPYSPAIPFLYPQILVKSLIFSTRVF